jgi:hypothetical protein
MHRSKHPITIRMAPKTELTPDHNVILPGVVVAVDGTGGTFGEVLRRARFQYRCTLGSDERRRAGSGRGRIPGG